MTSGKGTTMKTVKISGVGGGSGWGAAECDEEVEHGGFLGVKLFCMIP